MIGSIASNKFGTVDIAVNTPDLGNGLISFIEYFGDVWVGPINKILFDNKYQQLLSQTLDLLFEIQDVADDRARPLGNRLEMCRLSLVGTWRWPIQATVSAGVTIWNNGQSRLLAAGLGRSMPWTNCKVMLVTDSDPKQIIQDPVRIHNDEQLLEYLCHPESSLSDVRLQARIAPRDQWKKAPVLLIENITSCNFNISAQNSAARVSNWITWREKFARSPVELVVHTCAPNSLTHSSRWNLEFDSDHTINYIDDVLIEELLNSLTDDHYHLFKITNEELVLDELFLWMDCDHNCFVDRDNRFLLIKRDKNVKKTVISTSYKY